MTYLYFYKRHLFPGLNIFTWLCTIGTECSLSSLIKLLQTPNYYKIEFNMISLCHRTTLWHQLGKEPKI